MFVMSKAKKIVYECEDNDNLIELVSMEDDVTLLDELRFSDCVGDSWLIIGVDDIRKALKLMNYKLVKEGTNGTDKD